MLSVIPSFVVFKTSAGLAWTSSSQSSARIILQLFPLHPQDSTLLWRVFIDIWEYEEISTALFWSFPDHSHSH